MSKTDEITQVLKLRKTYAKTLRYDADETTAPAKVKDIYLAKWAFGGEPPEELEVIIKPKRRRNN